MSGSTVEGKNCSDEDWGRYGRTSRCAGVAPKRSPLDSAENANSMNEHSLHTMEFGLF
jgi:hypothetical protein